MTQYIWNYPYEAVELEGEWIILNAEQCTVTKLNAVGGFCWSLLQAPQTLQALLQAIQEHYESVNDTVQQDVEHFVSDLMQKGLLRYAGK